MYLHYDTIPGILYTVSVYKLTAVCVCVPLNSFSKYHGLVPTLIKI
jgi:hypothetical protein